MKSRSVRSVRSFNLQNINVSLFRSVYDQNEGRVVSLLDLLLSSQYRERVLKARSVLADEKKYKKLKRSMPCFTPAGVFEGPLGDKTLKKSSNLICLDIDHMDEYDLKSQKMEFANLGCVAYAGLSLSGNGLFVLFSVVGEASYYDKWSYLADRFSNMGFGVDKSASNINRLRTVSYDPYSYINVFPIPLIIEKKKEPSKVKPKRTAYIPKTAEWTSEEDYLVQLVEQVERARVDVTSNYDDWIRIGFGLTTLGEKGREFFHRISQFYIGFSVPEANKVYDNLLKSSRGKVKIGSVIHTIRRFL